MPGVAQAANVTYVTSQVRKADGVDVRAMLVGIAPGARRDPAPRKHRSRTAPGRRAGRSP